MVIIGILVGIIGSIIALIVGHWAPAAVGGIAGGMTIIFGVLDSKIKDHYGI